jgi:hypothetical protein
VRLEHEGPESLWIAGGNGGRFLVILMIDEDTQVTRNLVDDTQPQSLIELTIEGNRSEYSARYCITKEIASDAACYYRRTSTLDPRFTWEDPYPDFSLSD